MLLDFYETGLGKSLSLSKGLDQAVPRSPGRENARVSGTDLGAAEKTIDVGAGLICRNWFEDQNDALRGSGRMQWERLLMVGGPLWSINYSTPRKLTAFMWSTSGGGLCQFRGVWHRCC